MFEDRDQLGLPRRPAGLRVHDRALGAQRWLTGLLLNLDKRTQRFVRLNGNAVPEIVVTSDTVEPVLSTKMGVLVSPNQLEQELLLCLARMLGGSNEGPPVRLPQ